MPFFFLSQTPQMPSQRSKLFLALCGGGMVVWLIWLGSQGLWQAVFGFAALAGLLILSQGQTQTLFAWWLALTPFLSFFARFPQEKSLLTFDRLTVTALTLLFVRDVVNHRAPGRLRVGLFEPIWVVFCAFVFLDLIYRPGSSVYAWRTGFDAFFLPLVVFVIARQGIELNHIKQLAGWSLCGLAFFLFPIGAYELVTHHDVMAYPGSELYFDGMVRPNGPFAANHSLALISLIIALLLWHWPVLLEWPETGWQRLVRQGASLMALAASALPLFRGIWVTAGICALLPSYLTGDTRQRQKILLTSLVAVGLVLMGGRLAAQTEFYQSRVANPENIYTRLATYQAAVQVFEDNWLTGVGLTRYTEEYNRVYYNEDDYNRKYPTIFGEIPRNSPHNNILAIFAEMGIVTGVLYVLAHLMLLMEGIVMCRSLNSRVQAGGRLLVVLWLAYWIPGMMLASGYYADLNFYFFAACGLILGIKRQSQELKTETQFANADA